MLPKRAPPGVVFDIETCSRLDLRKAGAARYALDCIPICLAWKRPGGATQAWRAGEPPPDDLCAAVRAGVPMHAWNIAFDRAVWNAQLVPLGFPALPLEQTHDIMARALYWGLPGSLDQAGEALGLATRKSKTGKALMMRMARPRLNGGWWHEEDPARLDELVEYCRTDTDSEAEAHDAIPDLPPAERQLWLLDQQMNEHGIRLDMELVGAMERVTAEALRELDARLARLTNGQVPGVSKRNQLFAWLSANGYAGADVARDTVLRELPHATGLVREVLQLRLDSARTSTAKLASFRNVADPIDHRARGLVQYYGAGRTGRWAGRLSQPHNLPRPTIKTVPAAIDAILAGDGPADLELFHADSALGIVASCLRGAFVPAPGHAFVVADLAQIEARVIAWLAGQLDILAVFRRREDVYVYTASRIGSTSRQLGKVVVLACGFGMGPMRFIETAAGYGLHLSMVEADDIVTAWRRANSKTVRLWYAYDEAMREVVSKGGTASATVRGVGFEMWRGHCLVTLPSSRQLVYRDALVMVEDGRPSITYMGVDQSSRAWGRTRTYGGKIAENITQAVARDVMADALLAVAVAGRPLLTVHDELLMEAPVAEAGAVCDRLLAAMRRPPSWGDGLPVWAEGGIMARYGK